jgi:hypothetical protein
MEKQTKILLGIGVVIAAYLILKPKMAVTSGVAVVPSEEKPQPKVTGGYACPDGTIDYNYTDRGDSSPCVGHGVIQKGRGGCACIAAPCNCGGGVSGGYAIM